MTSHIIIWASGSIAAFFALRSLALRDFGVITVGGLIALLLYSLLAPAALLTAFCVYLMGDGRGKSPLSRPVWKRRA